MRFFCTTICCVTLVTRSLFQTFLYIKYISSIFEIDFIRWDFSRTCHSSLSTSKISASGILFFPSTIFCIIIGPGAGGRAFCCLLYQFWKKIPFAKILNSNTCSIVNKVNFKLICVDVLRSENLNVKCENFVFRWCSISSKYVCMVVIYTIKQ